MPRKAPKEVIEHRITFGDYERKQLEQTIDAYQTDKIAENVPNFIIGGAAVVAAGGVALAAYALYQWFELPPIKEILKDAAEDTDRFFRPYAYDDVENTVVGPTQHRGKPTAYLEYTYPYTSQIKSGNWETEKPYAIQSANSDFDSRKGQLEGRLEIAQKWAESDDWIKRPMGKKLIPPLETQLSNLEVDRSYVIFCLENVIFDNKIDNFGQIRTTSHIPPNQWYESGHNWPPPVI